MATQDHFNILHIASFTGNVGDNANHNGTRRTLRENTSFEYTYTENEIRRYYQKYTEDDALAFDDTFVSQANDHDAVFIGSGNFFELWIEESVTGTTIDIKTERIEEVSSPIIFYGLGCDPYKGIPRNNREKFENFLDFVLDQDHCLVSVRNDGSMNHLRNHFGDVYEYGVEKVPDGGFFTGVDDGYHPELDRSGRFLALNVARDMKDLRFPASRDYPNTYNDFISEFAAFCDDALAEFSDLSLVFIPHIYSDLEAISDVLHDMENMNRRSRAVTAPYLNGEGAERYIFDIYRKCDLASGMRFHTNVCSIGQNTPSIGLVSYPKVEDLYGELGMEERVVDLRKPDFKDKLLENVKTSFETSRDIKADYRALNSELRESLDQFHAMVENHLKTAVQ